MGCLKLEETFTKLTVHIGEGGASKIIEYDFSERARLSRWNEVDTSLNSSRLPQKSRVETGYYYYGARYYNPKVSHWLSVDKMVLETGDPYGYCFQNPIRLVDPDGNRPIPLNDLWKGWTWKIDSWVGNRKSTAPGMSTNHKGIDFNYSGGGNTDYGAPILTTHDGIVTVADGNPDKGEGRHVVVTSEDGKFRTRYFHLSEVDVEVGQKVSESDEIGKMGGSANGKNLGRKSHLHYEIQTVDENGNWITFDPSEGTNDKNKIVDPQDWIKKPAENNKQQTQNKPVNTTNNNQPKQSKESGNSDKKSSYKMPKPNVFKQIYYILLNPPIPNY